MRRQTVHSILLCFALVLLIGAAEAPIVEQLQANPALLDERYKPLQSLTVEEHQFREDIEPGAQAQDGKDLYVVKNGTQTLYIEKHPFQPGNFGFRVINSDGAKVVCLPNPDGGNGWRVNPWFVVLRNPLKLLGQVSDIRDIDADGDEELVVYDDIWEAGFGGLSHAGAPLAEILYRVRGETLEVDRQATQECAYRNISRLNTQIQKALSKDSNKVPLSAILSKFLCYRAMGRIDSGWEELRKDLRAFDSKHPLASSPTSGDGLEIALTQEEIERRITESLGKRGPLEKDLEAYTLEPLK